MVKGASKKTKVAIDSDSGSHRQDLPSFDENALATLTDRIDKGLKGGKLPKSASKSEESPLPQGSNALVGSGLRKNKEPSRGPSTGKKRDSQGNVKGARSGSSSKPDLADRPRKKGPLGRDVLLQEILTLGGTEEDLDLIGDVDSDGEDSETNNGVSPVQDSKFSAEFSKFISGLGFASHSLEDGGVADADDAEATQEEDDPWEDEIDINNKPYVPNVRASENEKLPQKGTKQLNHLIFQARPDWHAAELPELPMPNDTESNSYHEAITELKKYAVSLLEADSNTYASKHLSSTSSHRFLATIMSSGTLSDKVSALTLVVQESPVHTTKSFESLLSLAKKRSRGQAVSALGAMKDLLGSGVVLPSNRRLWYFSNQPGLLGTLQDEATRKWTSGKPLPGSITKAHLISWAYEDWLKDMYFDMLKVLEGWCNDEIEFARQRAVTYVYELLREKPEQEANLLRLMVNKLGDPEKKIASRASYLVLQLQITHPLMKPIIIRAIETELLLRPNQSSHARYYAINTLNQTILSGKEEEVARKLLSIYFDLFVTLLRKPEESSVAVGPVVNKKGQVQGGGGQVGKMAKEKASKEQLAKQASQETTEKMISVVLTGVNRAFPFAGADDITLEKHMDMLFRITHSANFNTSIQALMLIQQLATSKNIAVDRFYRTLYESLLDPRLVTSSKHALYLNLLFRALKNDMNIRRIKAFVKRLVQVITLHQPPFICGILYLLRELETSFPGLQSLLNDPEEQDEPDEEVFRDVPEDTETTSGLKVQQIVQEHSDQNLKSSQRRNVYDGRKRDPEHSNADRSCLWELLPFLAHFHPSVSLFASRLLEDTEMPAKPDLAAHTLIHFLDRFVYKNAKAANTSLRGSSIMQPLAGGDSRGVLVSNRALHQNEPVNSESFWRRKAEDIAVDEVFFHKYFNQIGKSRSAARKFKDAKTGTAPDGADEEAVNEDEIWQALVESRPEVEGDGSEDESDLEMLDLDDSDDSDSNSGEEETAIELDDDLMGDAADFDDEFSVDYEDEGGVIDNDVETLPDENQLFNRELQVADPVNGSSVKETSRSKKRRMKSLPTFASVEDYAAMLEQDDEEDA